MKTVRRHAALLLLLFPALLSAAAPAASAGMEFLPGFAIAVPPGSKAAARLVVPPASPETLDRLSWTGTTFAVGSGGVVWLGRDDGTLVNFTKGFKVRLSEPFSDIASLRGGALLVAGREALGFLPAGTAFQPIFSLPVTDARLAAGERGALYLFGAGRESGRNELYLLKPEASSPAPKARKAVRAFRKIFSTAENLSAAAGDGDVTFVAVGRLVLKITTTGQERIATVFVHPREDVTDLAWSRAHGLFYATPSGIGCAGPKETLEFIHAPNAAIRLVDGALYVLLKNSLAVVKVEGIDAFKPK